MNNENKNAEEKIEQLTQSQVVDLTNIDLSKSSPFKSKISCGCASCRCNNQSTSQRIILPCNYHSQCIINDGNCPFNLNHCTQKPTKIFKTLIRGKVHWIYNRPDCEHDLGKLNGCPTTWWLAKIEKNSDITWIPWIDRVTNRPCWEINVKQDNYIKYKYEENNIYSTCSIEMKCNGQIVYEFGCNDINYGMSKAQYKMIEMMEHPFNFMNPEEEIGRRIWYKGQAGVIERLLLDQGCIIIGYRGAGAGFDLSNPWDTNSSGADEWLGEKSVKDDVFSGSIYWFREKGQGTKDDNDMIEIVTDSGNKVVYPKSLYNQIKYDVEFEFRRQFGIKRGGGDTVFFDQKIHNIPEDCINKSLSLPLKQYDEELQYFHRILVEKYILKNR